MADDVERILKEYKRIAVYGMSTNPEKAAHRVPAYLLSQGYDIVPVNPGADKILDRKSYGSLHEVEGSVDIVEVFRPSEEALKVAEEAVKRKKEKGDIAVLWLQEGIKNEEARKLAEANGITFVENHCMLKEHKRFVGS